MRYLCVHCEHRWEDPAAEPPRRCPSCLRATGVQAEAEAKGATAPARSRRSLHFIGAAVLAVLAAVGGYFLLGRRPKAVEGTTAVLTSAELDSALRAAQADAGELKALLEPEDTIQKFAAQAEEGKSHFDKADAVQAAMRARARALAFIPWSLGEPRPTVVMTAKQALATISKDKARAELYPLEAAALMTAALRAIHVPALVAELHDVEGEPAPLDPSGFLGYFGVAVYADEAGVGAPRLYDPYGGRTLKPEAKHTVLRDPQAVGCALALRALHEISYVGDPGAAIESSSDALQLAGTLPSVRTVRGMVVLAGKQIDQGLQEFAAARQLRSDAARLHNLATAELMTGDVDRASKDLQAALSRAPEFAGAHATLGSLSLLTGNADEARSQLEKAEKLAPDLALVQWALAEYWLRNGDRERALSIAQRALDHRPSFDAQLRMGLLLRQAGRYEEMRTIAANVLARAPAHRRDELRELIKAALGPTALDEAGDLAEPSREPAASDHRKLDLREGSSLLGGDQPGLGESKGPRLRLGDDDLKLKLKR